VPHVVRRGPFIAWAEGNFRQLVSPPCVPARHMRRAQRRRAIGGDGGPRLERSQADRVRNGDIADTRRRPNVKRNQRLRGASLGANQ
jgi:hypothetical protein